mmetsp:Transcript_56290/g.178206  ORF Transcript_56290/g.178206 Transcript_56290/m.178206 type:complete len:429 (+) Transcript_56290:283-1569(+)
MPVGALMIGAGEYTTGYVPTATGAANDKPAGVVAISFIDMKRFGKIGKLVLADAVGTKMPAVRANIAEKIGAYADMDCDMETFPSDDVKFQKDAYKDAIARMQKGDIVTIFTPDDTHFEIAMSCMQAGLHVMIAKPAVKTLEHHLKLCECARANRVLCCVEYHKRFDPIYDDARNRVRGLGSFSFFTATMTQPKQQLDTFAGWAGKSSDISYYLNSHHIDWHCWSVSHMARPLKVVAMAARGIAEKKLEKDYPIEDTITLMTSWEDTTTGDVGTALYTASWASPKADSHTQQNFHYMGHKGEIRADQAKRGYTGATDADGYATMNPLYMKYVPDHSGHFAGQTGYGYVSLLKFVEAAEKVNGKEVTLEGVCAEGQLATVQTTLYQTAILEAGRLSLDNGNRGVLIEYNNSGKPSGLTLQEEGADKKKK